MTSEPADVSSTQAAKAVLKQLHERFPVFAAYQPLAIGIDKQLIALEPTLKSKALRTALSIHTKSIRYLKALQVASTRANLDGSPADAVTDEQRGIAATALHEYFKRRAQDHRARQEEEAKAELERKKAEKLNLLVDKFSRK
jgi:ProP effector